MNWNIIAVAKSVQKLGDVIVYIHADTKVFLH